MSLSLPSDRRSSVVVVWRRSCDNRASHKLFLMLAILFLLLLVVVNYSNRVPAEREREKWRAKDTSRLRFTRKAAQNLHFLRSYDRACDWRSLLPSPRLEHMDWQSLCLSAYECCFLVVVRRLSSVGSSAFSLSTKRPSLESRG